MSIQTRISELEEITAQTAQRISEIKSKRCLVLINDPNKADQAINWLQNRLKTVNQLVLVMKTPPNLNTPIAVDIENVASKNFLPENLVSIISKNYPSSILHCIPSLELTASVVSFLREKSIEAVIVAGGHCLTRREYENVQDFKPFIEEIVLKEAIQPVILIK